MKNFVKSIKINYKIIYVLCFKKLNQFYNAFY